MDWEAVVHRLGVSAAVLDVLPLSATTARLRVRRFGRVRELVVKRSGPAEAWFYRRFGALGLGAPRCLGLRRAEAGRWDLLLQALPEEWPDLADPAAVRTVYRHLGLMHRRTAGLVGRAGTVLLHGDYHRWNLTIVGGRVRVLDWEHARPGQPVWDLALLGAPGPAAANLPPEPLVQVALRAYHEAGPLASLPWRNFQRLHLACAADLCRRREAVHRWRAAGAGPGEAAVLADHAEAERERAEWLEELWAHV